jgi:antitoxin HicB
MKKNLNYYLGLKYPVTVEEDKDGYSLEIPDLPGCHAYGTTLDEAWKRLEESKKAWLTVSIENNFEIEEPKDDQFSGKLLLRIPPKLHAKMAREAKKRGISLNRHLQVLLEEGTTLKTLRDSINEIREELKSIKEKPEKVTPAFSPGVAITTATHSPRVAITTVTLDQEFLIANAKSNESAFFFNSGIEPSSKERLQ